MKIAPSSCFAWIIGAVIAAARLLAADASPTNAVVTTTPVYVPDMTHANDPLPDGVLAWEQSDAEATNAAADQLAGAFYFQLHECFVRQRRHRERPSVVRLHHRAIAAAAVDHPARHERSDSASTVNLAGKTGMHVQIR